MSFEWACHVEPSHCRECGARIITVTRAQPSELEPAEPARWGCGHLASEYRIVLDPQDVT